MTNYVNSHIVGKKLFFHFMFDEGNQSEEYLKQKEAWCNGDDEVLQPLFNDARDKMIVNLCEYIEELANEVNELKRRLSCHA